MGHLILLATQIMVIPMANFAKLNPEPHGLSIQFNQEKTSPYCLYFNNLVFEHSAVFASDEHSSVWTLCLLVTTSTSCEFSTLPGNIWSQLDFSTRSHLTNMTVPLPVHLFGKCQKFQKFCHTIAYKQGRLAIKGRDKYYSISSTSCI